MADGPPEEETGIEILEIVGFSDEELEVESLENVPELPVHLSQARERGRKDGIRMVLRDLLPALDDLESCVRKAADRETMEEGVRLGLRQLWDAFRVHEMERVEGTGIPFDPSIHDAVSVTKTDRVESNVVLEVLRVGYMLAGELVRPAMVRVSGPVEEEELIDERFRDGVSSPGEESTS